MGPELRVCLNRMSAARGRCPRKQRAHRAQAPLAPLAHRKPPRPSPLSSLQQCAGALPFPAAAASFRSPRRRLGNGRDFRFRAGGAGLPGRGRGRHFRSGPRVSPERRRLLRLLGLLPAETPAPVSDGRAARGPGRRGRGAPPWPAAVLGTPPRTSVLLRPSLARASPYCSPKDCSRCVPHERSQLGRLPERLHS